MPIKITKKSKEGGGFVIEGNAQLIDEMSLSDKPKILKECTWKAHIESGQTLWTIDIISGDDLRGYIQQELQKRTKRKD